ncbi:MAG: sigma-70 family RNA polymerase sigma factor [Armatimonadetes bacterium]|nr:sigma-70 family RNA polymerase sigma factor [Armatimonadota bacterium]
MPASHSTDLIDRARAGDARAFEALVAGARADLWAFFLRATRCPELARDLLQETLLLAWQGLAGYRAEAQLRTWLFRIARNRLISFRRQQPALPPLSLDALATDEVSPHEPGDPGPLLADVFVRTEFAHFLIEAAHECCETHEYLALMLAYRGLEVREIADMLRLRENHVRVLTFRARGKLLAHLFRDYPDAVGGAEELAEAFSCAAGEMTPAEAAVFRQTVLERRPPCRSVERLRAACLKVARYLRGL